MPHSPADISTVDASLFGGGGCRFLAGPVSAAKIADLDPHMRRANSHGGWGAASRRHGDNGYAAHAPLSVGRRTHCPLVGIPMGTSAHVTPKSVETQ